MNEYLRIKDLATTASRAEREYTDPHGRTRIVKAQPARKGLLPMGESTIWAKVKSGEFPQPIKLSQRVTAWKKSDIEQWLAQQAQTNH